MNPQETQQVTTHDEKWVPFTKRVKISSINVRLETIVPKKEETFQVVIDLIKNSSCFKAFTISVDVLESFMQQFWYSIKKVQGTDSYEFLLANKKCIVNADVFRMILDICLRVDGVDFTDNSGSNIQQRENVDYPKLIWEDLAFQIDHMKEKRSRREDYQEYGLAIPEVMINDAIKQSESYQMFIKYSTSQIPPKKSRGKGSQRKKTTDDSQETVDVSKESKPEHEPVKKKTASRRVVKKKVTISTDDNIIPDPDVALELGKSISLAEAKEEEVAKQVYATNARIVTESVPEPTRRRKSSKVTFDPPKKVKGVPSLTLEEKEAADIMQALKESKKTSKRQPGTRGSSEGTSTIPGVPDESTFVSTTLSEGTGTKPGVPNEEKDITKEYVILEWGSEQESEYSEEDKLDDEEKDDKKGDVDDEGDDHICDIQHTDDEDDETESDEDDIYKKSDEEDTDAAKADAEMTEEAEDDSKKAELPPTSSSLSIFSGFGDQFLKLSSDTSLVVLTPVQETSSAAPVTTLLLPSVSTIPTTPLQQTTTPIPTPPITTDAPTITTVVFEFDALSAI
ncbi:hypothetical protein Tco_0440095 [Tanacetum coccineum]